MNTFEKFQTNLFLFINYFDQKTLLENLDTHINRMEFRQRQISDKIKDKNNNQKT